MKKVRFILNNNEKPTIAIIGIGRFGKLLTKIFLQWSIVNIQVVSSRQQHQTHSRLSFVDIHDIASADLIIPCVPISAFEKTIRDIAPIAKKSAIVMDVCSVKMIPVQLMKTCLAGNIQIIASHPLFGPDSFRLNKGLKDLRMVFHNVSAQPHEFLTIMNFFKRLGVKILKLSPQKHDQLLAWSLGYSYLVGTIGQQLKLKKSPIDTFDFKLLMKNMKIVGSDSEELFMDMQTYNPFAHEVHKKFSLTTQKILDAIKLRSVDNRHTRV